MGDGGGGAGESRRRQRRRRRQSHGILSNGSSQEVLTEEDVGGSQAQDQVIVTGSEGEDDEYVDQNRNLNLSEIAEQDKEQQQEQIITTTSEQQQQELEKRNVSPILSLSSASEQSGSSDCCTTSDLSTETTSNTAELTTARISQASLTAPQQQQVNGDCKGSQEEEGEQLSSRYAGRRTRFATDNSQGSLEEMHDDDHDDNGARTIICMMRDDEQEQCDVLGMSPYEDFAKSDLEDRTNESLVRSLGRRVSLLPRLLARRRMSSHHHHHHHHLVNHPLDDSRRFSLQTHDPLLLRNTSGSRNEANLDRVVAPEVMMTPVEPVVAVAGVGGTITTVTRSKRKTAPLPRLVAKNGQVNLFLDNIDRRQYVRDLFTTMIDIKWRYNLMAAAFGFVFSWLFFACIWYLVLYFHDDLAHENDPQWSPCIVNVYSFPAALLFSIETQSTLGFGSRIISVECPGAIVIFCSQLIFGVVVECLIVGMVFAKLSRPTKRSQTIMYSQFATVCLRESKMCLTFRVGDVRSKSHIIGATIRASLVSSKITQEGEHIPFYHYKLNVHIDDCKQSLLLIWPVTIVHVIDETSPFYELDSEALSNFKFEIITVLEGTVESTGQSIQVRSSYLPSEVKWGYRFEPIVSTHGYGRYAQTIIDYNKFNRILEVPTPRCSPLDYYKSGGGGVGLGSQQTTSG